MKKINSVDEYIAVAPKEVRNTLQQLRSVIRKAAPKATERISYGMPFYEYGGTGIKGRLIYFAAFKKHFSLFIMPNSQKDIPPEMKEFHISKATYKFPIDKPLPYTLISQTIKNIVKARNVNQI